MYYILFMWNIFSDYDKYFFVLQVILRLGKLTNTKLYIKIFLLHLFKKKQHANRYFKSTTSYV